MMASVSWEQNQRDYWSCVRLRRDMWSDAMHDGYMMMLFFLLLCGRLKNSIGCCVDLCNHKGWKVGWKFARTCWIGCPSRRPGPYNWRVQRKQKRMNWKSNNLYEDVYTYKTWSCCIVVSCAGWHAGDAQGPWAPWLVVTCEARRDLRGVASTM